MLKLKHYLTGIMLLQVFVVSSQIISVSPANPDINDTVTVTYDASQGNGDLAGFSGDVFAHTGLITDESFIVSDWVNVQGNWAMVDSTVLMTSLGADLYSIQFVPVDFYGIEPNEEVFEMAFLFRNSDASIVGADANGEDIFTDLTGSIPIELVSYTYSDPTLTLTTNVGQLIYESVSPSIVKVTSVIDTQALDTTFSVIRGLKSGIFSFNDQANSIVLQSDSLEILVIKDPFSVHFLRDGDTLLMERGGFFNAEFGSGLRFNISEEEAIYGTGSRALPVDRRGYFLNIYNLQWFGYSNGAEVLNISIPFYISSKMYGVYFDHIGPAYLETDFIYENSLSYGTTAKKLSYYFLGASSNQQLLDDYTILTGKQPLPPRWSLGYIQSKFGYESESEAREIVDTLLESGYPLEAIILDLYWFSEMGDLDWNAIQWQDPQQMISDFEDQGVKTILITEPYVESASANFSFLDNNGLLAYDSMGNTIVLPDFFTGPAALLDLTNPVAQDWMWDFYEDRIQEGVAAWWCDLGEPEQHPIEMEHAMGSSDDVHNIFSLLWAKMLYEKYKTNYPDTRLFNLSRSGYAGMQRFSTFPWSGDVSRSWSGLSAQVRIMLGMSMTGIGYMHSDIGGFTGGPFNPELYTRWMQLGTFVPVMRAHGTSFPTEPVFYPEENQEILKKYINLRYQFLPYNYTLAWENSLTGAPLARPLNYHYPHEISLKNVSDEFFWGANLLVAPVVSSGASTKTVRFPPGIWIDYWNQKSYEGPVTNVVAAPLNQLPLFVKAGSFIPLAPEMSNTVDYNSDTLIIEYFPDESEPNSYYTMYHDDGIGTSNLDSSRYEILSFTGELTANSMEVTCSKSGGFDSAPIERQMILKSKRFIAAPSAVKKNGSTLQVVESFEDLYTLDSAAFWSESEAVLYVQFNWFGDSTTITIEDYLLGIPETEQAVVGPTGLEMYDAFPNPFSSATYFTIQMTAKNSFVLRISDISGKTVHQRSHSDLPIGKHMFSWNGKSENGVQAKPGIYFIEVIDQNGFRKTQKVILMK